jgi:hypothetical protein
MGAFDRFVSSRAGAWSKDLWDGLISAIDARFAPLEEQLDIQKETTDKIVGRGLQIIEDEIAPAVTAANDALANVQADEASVAAILAAMEGAGLSADFVITTALKRFVSDAEMGAKAPLASPTFTGAPAAPTAAGGTNTTQIATTAFVKAAVDALISAAPGALDTLDELAAALGDDANFASTVTTALAARLRFDAAQSLSGGQKTQAQQNIGLDTAVKSDSTSQISKGYTLAPNSLGTKSSAWTIDPTLGNSQYMTNGGAHTVTAPSADCRVEIDVTNNASAGALSFSGFTGSIKGDAYNTTNGDAFTLVIRRTNGVTRGWWLAWQ